MCPVPAGLAPKPSVSALHAPFGHIKKQERQKMKNFKTNRKQDSIEPHDVRQHQVKIMLNDEEVEFLNIVRGRHSRAEAFRFLLVDNPPKSVPELNQKAWVNLATAVANLNQIAQRLNFGELPEIEKIKSELSEFRAALLGASI